LKTRFVCESCGKDVPYNAEVCSHCGRLFSGVKCPVCKTSGRPEKFRNGCPVCGYLSPKLNNTFNNETAKKYPGLKKIRKNKKTSMGMLFGLLFIMLIAIVAILIIKGNL
jgi:predicted nucleic acid-binding Zn ribbon protein